MHPDVHCSIIYKSQDMEATYVSINGKWIKELCIYTMEYDPAIKSETLTFLTWIDLEGIVLNEISQTEKEKYHMISLTWNLKHKINEQTKQTNS